MSRCKIVVVPRWLDRIAKESGISDVDLISLEKLSRILSTRDVELYQMLNFTPDEYLAKSTGMDRAQLTKAFSDFSCPIPTLPLERRAAYSNVDSDAFVFGANFTRNAEDVKYVPVVNIGDADTLLIRLVPVSDETPGCFFTDFAKQVHALLPFEEWAKTNVAELFIRKTQSE